MMPEPLRGWWKHESPRGYDAEFVGLVNSALAEIDDERNGRWLSDLKSDVKEPGDTSSSALSEGRLPKP